jgi:hypothetical protein
MRKHVTKESLIPGMKVMHKKTKAVGTVRGKVSDPTELATAREGYVSVLTPQNRPDFPFRIVCWEIRHLVET